LIVKGESFLLQLLVMIRENIFTRSEADGRNGIGFFGLAFDFRLIYHLIVTGKGR